MSNKNHGPVGLAGVRKPVQGCPTPNLPFPSAPRLQNGGGVIARICWHRTAARTEQISVRRAAQCPGGSLLGTGCPVAGWSPKDSPGRRSGGQIGGLVLVVTACSETPRWPRLWGRVWGRFPPTHRGWGNASGHRWAGLGKRHSACWQKAGPR